MARTFPGAFEGYNLGVRLPSLPSTLPFSLPLLFPFYFSFVFKVYLWFFLDKSISGQASLVTVLGSSVLS